MASTRRKSAAIALAVVGVAGLSLASAAQLTVNSAALGAGAVTVESCDDEVDVDYTTAFQSGAYVVTAVTVTALDGAACVGQTIEVTVEGTTAASQTVAAADTSKVFSGLSISAESVENVAVVIHS